MANRRPIIIDATGRLAELTGSDGALVPLLVVAGTTTIDAARAAFLTAATIDSLVLDGSAVTAASGEVVIDGADRVRIKRAASLYPRLSIGDASAVFGAIARGLHSDAHFKLWATAIDLDWYNTDGAASVTVRIGREANVAGLVTRWYLGNNTGSQAATLDHKTALFVINPDRAISANAGVHIYRKSGYQARLGFYGDTGAEEWVFYMADNGPLKLWDGSAGRVAATVNTGGTVELAGRLKAGTSDTLRRLISLPSALAVGAISFDSGGWVVTPGNTPSLWVSLDVSVGTKIKSARARVTSASSVGAWIASLTIYSRSTTGTNTSRFTGTNSAITGGTAQTIDATGTAYTVEDGTPLLAKIEVQAFAFEPDENLVIHDVELELQEQVV